MNCCSCKKYIKTNEESWICEECGGEHHKECSGDNSPGFGEYPDESAYSICERCLKKLLVK